MKRFQEIFPGNNRSQHWFMLRSAQQLEHFNQEPWLDRRDRAFLADKLPSEINPNDVKALCIEDVFARETDFVDLPGSIHQFPGLAYLRLPRKYVPQLQPEAIPASVRVLEIIGEGKATFSDKISLPQIEKLAGLPTELKFTQNTFPRLRHLTLRLDSRRTMLAVLAKLDHLETLALSPNRDGAVFEVMGEVELKALYLGSGKIQTLDGIERLQSLVAVGLTSMDKLENIAGLVKLPKLAEVSLSWCANLSNYEALLGISTLEHLDIFGCKKFDPSNYGPKLQALALKTLSLPQVRPLSSDKTR